MAEKIPSWPKVTIRLYDDHNAEVKIAGRGHPVNHHDPRQAAIALVSERAGQLGRPVKATAVESDGASWPLIIHPDGRVEAVETDGGGKGRGGNKPIWPIIVAAAVACALIAGTAAYLLVFSKGDGTAKTTASPKLPTLPTPSVGPDQFVARPVPPGWSNKASWTVDIAPNTVPAVSPDGTEVAVLTPDSKLAVFDGNGKVLWQDKVPKQVGSPIYTVIDSKPVLALATDDTCTTGPATAPYRTRSSCRTPPTCSSSAPRRWYRWAHGGRQRDLRRQAEDGAEPAAFVHHLACRRQPRVDVAVPGTAVLERAGQDLQEVDLNRHRGQGHRSRSVRQPGPCARAVEDRNRGHSDPGRALDRQRLRRRNLPAHQRGQRRRLAVGPGHGRQRRGLG